MSELANKLRAKFDLFTQVNTFKPGDVIIWKEGMKDRKVPDDRQPAVVLEVLPEPMPDNRESPGNSHYACSRYDLIIGFLDRDGDFHHYHADSRRYRHFQE